jgi:hypothetical protein
MLPSSKYPSLQLQEFVLFLVSSEHKMQFSGYSSQVRHLSEHFPHIDEILGNSK